MMFEPSKGAIVILLIHMLTLLYRLLIVNYYSIIRIIEFVIYCVIIVFTSMCIIVIISYHYFNIYIYVCIVVIRCSLGLPWFTTIAPIPIGQNLRQVLQLSDAKPGELLRAEVKSTSMQGAAAWVLLCGC